MAPILGSRIAVDELFFKQTSTQTARKLQVFVFKRKEKKKAEHGMHFVPKSSSPDRMVASPQLVTSGW